MDNRPKTLVFSAAQNRIITSTLTLLCGTLLVVSAILLLFGLLQGLNYFLNIVGPIIVAFFLSLLTRPWYARLRTWFGGRDVPAVFAFSMAIVIAL